MFIAPASLRFFPGSCRGNGGGWLAIAMETTGGPDPGYFFSGNTISNFSFCGA